MDRLHLLGAIELVRADGVSIGSVLAQPKRLAMLAYLALLKPRGFHRRDQLLSVFWPEKDEERARNSLRQALHFLKASLGSDLFELRGSDEIRIGADRLWVDALEFERLAADGRTQDALELYRGGFMGGFHLPGAPELEAWRAREEARLRDVALRIAIRAGSDALRAGRHGEASVLARRAMEVRPLSEPAARLLMEIQRSEGDRTGALRTYERLERGLLELYDLEPEPETRELVESIRGDSNGFRSGADREETPGTLPESLAIDTEPAGGAAAGVRAGHRERRERWWERVGAFIALFALLLVAAVLVGRLDGGGGVEPSGRVEAAAPGWPEHVLWVDDNPENNDAETRFLESRGVEVTRALSTSAALVVYDPSEHHVVVSDMGRVEFGDFDGSAGEDLLLELRARDPGARLVFYTSARSGETMGERLRALGAWGVAADSAALFELIRGSVKRLGGRVVLAAIEASPEDADLASLLDMTLRIDLERSDRVSVVPHDRVLRTLARMGYTAGDRATPDLATEVARRDGHAAIVAGRVISSGEGVLLSVRVLSPEGNTLFVDRQVLSTVEEMQAAIEQLSRGVREFLGESAASLRNAVPLPEVSTHSYEALRAYALGQERMKVSDYTGAEEHFQQAVELDSLFALAWVRLGASLRNRSRWPRAIEALERAMPLRDRLPRLEQLQLDFNYAEIVSGDMAAAAAAADALLDLRPDLRDVWLKQQVLIAFHTGSWEEGERRAKERRDLLGGLPATSWWNLVSLQLLNGHDAEVDESLARWEAEWGPESQNRAARFRVAFQRQNWARAIGLLDASESADPSSRHGITYWRGLVALGAGRLGEADAAFDSWRIEETNRAGDHAVLALDMWDALADLEIRRDTARAHARLDRGMEVVEGAPASARIVVAWVAAALGRTADARHVLDRYEATSSRFDLERRPREYWAALGALHLAAGDLDAALVSLRSGRDANMARAFECQFCPQVLLGRALEEVGDRAGAIAAYTEFVNARWVFGPDRELDAAFLVPVRERLAVLLEERGDVEGAAYQYAEIARQWSDADPELRPRVLAAEAALRRLGR